MKTTLKWILILQALIAYPASSLDLANPGWFTDPIDYELFNLMKIANQLSKSPSESYNNLKLKVQDYFNRNELAQEVLFTAALGYNDSKSPIVKFANSNRKSMPGSKGILVYQYTLSPLDAWELLGIWGVEEHVLKNEEIKKLLDRGEVLKYEFLEKLIRKSGPSSNLLACKILASCGKTLFNLFLASKSEGFYIQLSHYPKLVDEVIKLLHPSKDHRWKTYITEVVDKNKIGPFEAKIIDGAWNVLQKAAENGVISKSKLRRILKRFNGGSVDKVAQWASSTETIYLRDLDNPPSRLKSIWRKCAEWFLRRHGQ